MISSQVQRLREQLVEHLGKPIDDAALLYEGPSYWIWVGFAAIIGVVLFGVLELGGLVGGALIGATFATWYLFVKSISLSVSADEVHLVRMNTPLLGRSEPHDELIHHPRGAAPIERAGRKLDYGGRTLRPMPFWGGQAEAVVEKARGGESRAERAPDNPPHPPG